MTPRPAKSVGPRVAPAANPNVPTRSLVAIYFPMQEGLVRWSVRMQVGQVDMILSTLADRPQKIWRAETPLSAQPQGDPSRVEIYDLGAGCWTSGNAHPNLLLDHDAEEWTHETPPWFPAVWEVARKRDEDLDRQA